MRKLLSASLVMLLAVASALLVSLSFVSTAKAEPTVVATISVGSSPNGVAYDSGMGEVFVTSLVGTVSVISDVTNTVVATIPVGASGPYGVGVAYDSGMGEVLVTNFGVNTVSVISDVSNTVVATIPVGLQPLGAAYDSGMGEVFVTNINSNTVSVISDVTNTVVATISTGANPYGVAYDSGMGEVFVTNYSPAGTVSVISDVTNTVVATIPAGAYPLGVAYDSGMGEVFVTDPNGGPVSVISDVTNTVVATIPVGVGSIGVAYDSGMGEVFITNEGGATVSVISDVTNTVVATVVVGGAPLGVAYDNGKGEIFVANSGSNTVSVISDGTTSLHTTSTALSCTPSTVVVNQATSCTATVTDTSTGPTTPTGTVTFTPSGTCILAGAGASATCSADITPTETGTLSVSASYGGDTAHQSSSGFFSLSVNPGALSASFTVSPNPTQCGPVTFTATVTGGTTPYFYIWDFGDGSSAADNPATHTYTSSGDVTVNLLVIDANQVSTTSSQTISVAPSTGCFTVSFTVSANPTEGSLVTFTAAVTGGTMPYSFSWDFGDGSVSGTTNPVTHTYTTKGQKTVTLIVTDAVSATGTSSQTISVAGLPLSVSFTVSGNPTVGSPVTFTATVMGGTPPYTFSWDFGDGSVAGTGNPVTHTYASGGPKTVTLTVTDASNNGFVGLGDTWEFNAGQWTQLSLSASPSPRGEASMVYDTADGYVLLFGGGETWEFHGGQWTQLSPSTSPSVVVGFSMAYDAADGYVLLFGGISNSPGYQGETWEFHAGTWTQLSPSNSPPARFSASMAYDAADGYILLFGGAGNTVGILGDTWEFHGGQWTQLSPASSPSPRQYPSMVYDAADDHVLLFGGNNGNFLSDTWEFHAGTWTQLSPSNSPPARWLASMAYDAADSYALLFGGTTYASFFSDTWEFHAGAWNQLSMSTSPPARFAAFMAYDAADGYVLLFGGFAPAGGASSTTSQTISFASSFDFTISASPASVTVPPDTGISTITVAPTNGFTGTVDLTGTIFPATGLTCTLTPTSITGGSGTSTLSCSGVEGSYTVTVTGTSGSLSHSVDVAFTIAPPADFTISASSVSVTVTVGDTGTSTIGVTGVNGFTGTVDLTHVESPTTGLICSLSPTSITGGSGTSMLSCSGVAGSYTVTVSGGSGTLSHSVDVSFTVTAVPDFNIGASPVSVSILAGDTGTSSITISPVNGFTGTVDLTHSESPAGLACSLSPTSITGGSGGSTLSCSGSAGFYTVTVTGTSGPLTHSVDVTFNITPPLDFTISASPTSVTFAEGSSGTSTIIVAPLNGLTGTVDLTSSIAPGTGLTCSLTLTSITGGSGTSTLSCTGSAGIYTVTVTGTSGPLTHRLDVTFDVTFLTPAQASQNLIDAVKSLHLSSSAQTSLLGPLNNIVKILSDKDPTNDLSACDKLSSFINIVNNDQRKGILTMEQAAQLRQLATSIMVQLGC